jgi:hypothetical protein
MRVADQFKYANLAHLDISASASISLEQNFQLLSKLEKEIQAHSKIGYHTRISDESQRIFRYLRELVGVKELTEAELKAIIKNML